jgi:methyl-accepting chemotaxis protein
MFKGMKFKTQLLFSNGFILTLMLIMSIVVHRSMILLGESTDWVERTYEIKQNASELERLVIDMDADVHTFLILGQEELLQPFVKSQEKFDHLIAKLRKHIGHNVEQTEALGKIHLIAKQWLDEFVQPALMKRREFTVGAKDLKDLQDFVGSGIGKIITDEIQQNISKLRAAVVSKGDREAENHLMDILNDISESKASLRGFLLSGKEEFLEPFRHIQKQVNTHLNEFEEHLKDDVDNQKYLQQIKSLFAQWHEKAAAPALAIRYEINKTKTSFKDIQDFLERGIGTKYMSELHESFAKFIAIEDQLLQQRDHEQQNISQIVINIVIFGTLLAFVFGIVIVWVLARNIMQTVTKVLGTSTGLTTAIEEISRGNMNLSQRTEQQAASLEETSASMEQMTSTVQQNADNARQAAHLAAEAREKAQRGGDIVSTAIKSMIDINKSSKQVADIISTIDEIAFQTNLLALNAAVEAARAGEQGRGFAVVATEVRNLAQRSATAAKQIKQLISNSVSKVEEGTQFVNQSGKSLEEIVVSVKKVSDIVIEIAAASEEQAAGIRQVNKAILQMDETTQQNAALVEEAASASEAIRNQARNLKELMSFFDSRSIKKQELEEHQNHQSSLQPAYKSSIHPPSLGQKKQKITPGKHAERTHYQDNGGHHSGDWEDF